MHFSPEEIQHHAFPAVIQAGRACFARESVRTMQSVDSSIIASVKTTDTHQVVITREERKPLRFACTCGFAYAGACEHAVAVMLAVNAQGAVQTGMNFGEGPADPRTSDFTKDSRPDDEESLIRKLAGNDPVEIQTVADKPTGRLYLTEFEGRLHVELRFSYHLGLVEFRRWETDRQRLAPAGDGTICRVVRSRVREDALVSKLFETGLVQYQSGTFACAGDARQWVMDRLPALAGQGFEIYGKESILSSKTRDAQPRLSLSVCSRGDLLSCDVNLRFDGIPATLAALIDAVRAQSRYVLLSDGSTGVLPEGWVSKLAALLSVAQVAEEEKGLVFTAAQRPALDALLDMADPPPVRSAPASDFEGIRKQPLPAGFSATLRPYQIAGYEWFYFLRQHRLGGCLADDMGLGKTVMALALMHNEKLSNRPNKTSLVVAPTSVLFNWQREAKKFTPGLLMMLYHGDDRRRYTDSDFSIADVVLTSYGTLLRDIGRLKKLRFNYVILDEAQSIKNPLAHVSRAVRELTSDHRLTLSGTPIENNLSELWSMVSFLNPGMLGSYRQFCVSFARPIERERKSAAAEVLQKMIFPFVLRRTKEQVASDLPPKTETLLCTEMLPRQRTLYDITRDMYRSRIMTAIDRDGIEKSRLQILEGLLRLRQICCHPLLMDERFSGESGKFKLLDSSIDEIAGGKHKVLIFSQFVKALQLLSARLKLRGIRHEVLTGATRDRAAVVDRFQDNPAITAFLISLKAGGTGLNLTAADYVVHLDPWWNPAAENQATDRAYRIGQTRQVFVYKLISKNSIEEHIVALQEAKQELIDWIVRPEETFGKQLTRDDVAALFSA
jgi:non-specific serine/threonine protein kinase